jgi:hypothetical protein
MLGHPAFAIAVKALYACFKHLKDSGALGDLADKHASADLMKRTCPSSGQQGTKRKHASSPRSVGYANWLAGAANP